MNKLSMTIDISAIFRNIKRHLLTILMCGLIVLCISYVAVDYFIPKTYTTTLDFVVTGSETNPNTYALRLLGSAANRYVNILNSDIVKKEVAEYLGEESIPGEISATLPYGTNIIIVTCQARKPGDALRIARALRNSYKNVTDKIVSAYSIRALGAEDARHISESMRMSFFVAILLFFLVVMAGIALAVIAQIFNGKAQNLSQAGDDIIVPVLGSILHERKRRNNKDLLISSPAVSFAYVESVKKIALDVMEKLDEKNQKILLVTSALENEGKSTIAANLAVSLSNYKKKVLLLDFDLRMPAQYKVMETCNDCNAELQEYLAGKYSAEKLLQMNKGSFLHCCYLTKPISDADRVLESKKIRELLKKAAEVADYVIVDTSPCGLTRDAEVLVEMVDASLMVVRTDTSKISMVNSLARDLKRGHAKLIGFVLNDDFEKTHTGENDFGYSKYYGQKGSYYNRV